MTVLERFRFLSAAVVLLFTAPAMADGADLDAIAERLAEAKLDFDRAVDAAGYELPVSYGSLELASGVLVPAVMEGDTRGFEMVFVGQGRFRFEAPDAVEAQQLAYYTGGAAIDAPMENAVLISGDPGVVAAASSRARVEVTPEARAVAEQLYSDWTGEAERTGFGADEALLRAAADDPLGRDFRGLWFDSSRLGRAFFAHDPTELEAVSLGAYELFDDDDFRTARTKKRKQRAERNKRDIEKKLGRSVDEWIEKGAEEDDACGSAVDGDEAEERESFEWIKKWVSARSPDAHPQDEPPGVESESYFIRMTLSGADLDARAEAVLRLRPVTVGQNVVTLSLSPALDVCEIFYEDDEPVTFRRLGWRVIVSLPEPTVEEEPFELTVRYAGQPILHRHARRAQKSTLGWYPHAGIRDRATYELELRWPENLTLLASGNPLEEFTEDGVRYSRRAVDVPTLGVSFEIGDFDVVEDEVGHMALTVAFRRGDDDMTEETRAEIVDAVKASILLFESRLGLLPIDRMTVVMIDRGFSQGLLGFLTLAEGAIDAVSITGQRERLELISHEVSHQWWGHMVGWDNYRDQWLSEALATFSSARFMETISEDVGTYQRERSELWRRALRSTTFDGRPLGSVGPVVLGTRLASQGGNVYHSVVYQKGALIFSTLAQRLGPDETWEMLGNLAKAVNNRVIRTSTFFRAFERMSGQDLGGFVDQYVRGVGMPPLFYDYDFRRGDGGRWIIEGRVLQFPVDQSRFVLEATESGWDVRRHTSNEAMEGEWSSVIPFYAEYESAGTGSEATTGKVTLEGESSTFRIEVDGRPTAFRLDPFGQILADIHAEDFEPKSHLCKIGEHLGKLGRFEESLEVLTEALESPLSSRERATNDPASTAARELDARIRLARARVHLDREELAAARSELEAVEKLLPRDSEYYAGERAVLRTRMHLQDGASAAAFDVLNTYLSEHSAELRTQHSFKWVTHRHVEAAEPLSRTELKISRGEAQALLAVASYEAGDRDAALFSRLASVKGVDMRALRKN